MWSNNPRPRLLKELRSKRKNSLLTVIILGSIIFIFFLAYFSFGSQDVADPSLVQIHMLFRHGERTPPKSYPTDPNKDYKWDGGFGALTNKGKYSMYVLGQTLRKRYDNFLGKYYIADDVSVLSSYSPRCQMSGMTLLAGLYPPVGSQIWNNELLWQPIPVDPIPRNVDNLIAAKAPCKAFDVEKKKSDEGIQANLTDEVKKLFIYLSEHTGSSINNIEDVEFLYSTLKIEDEHGLVIPAWAKSVYPEPMKSIAARNLACYTETSVLKRLKGGPLLKQWIDHMENGKKKAYYYAGHDITLVTFMRTMGFNEPKFLPDYGATFILELHHNGLLKYVKALYYNSSHAQEPVTLTLPGCDTHQCSLEKFVKYLKPNIPEDWSKECNTVS